MIECIVTMHPIMKTMNYPFALMVLAICLGPALSAADEPFNGLDLNLGNLDRISSAQSRSISAENYTGEKGKASMAAAGSGSKAARDLGQGWKVSPFALAPKNSVFTLADITGSGAIQQIFITPASSPPLEKLRSLILRFYWDDETDPSVECPMGDFFACGWGHFCQVNSLPVCVNPESGLNCYWQMPFHKRARITVENLSDKDMLIAYQINYTLTDVPPDAGYFHAQFRRENPVKTKGLYTILDGVEGTGQYVGTYLAWGPHSNGWWGEGQIKFYIDGDKQFPTICGTGTEDYFCGTFGFMLKGPDGIPHYTTFSTPYSGMPQIIRPDGEATSQERFGLYRWHIMDPVRFQHDLKVTIQDLGWKASGGYRLLQDDISSVAFWYQTGPHAKYPPLPSRDDLQWQ